MSGDRMTWVFELLDRMSGPADRIAKKLKVLDPALKTTGGQASAFSRAIGFIGQKFGPQATSSVLRFANATMNLGAKLRPVANVLGSVGSVAGKGLAVAGTAMVAIGVAAATAFAGAAVAGGRFVAHALVFKEDSLTAFEAILGSKAEAEKVMAMATKFAAKTPFQTGEVIDLAKSLLTRGFKPGELEKLMLGVGDVGAMLGTEKMDSVINALGKMRSSGKLTGETMAMLADAGINSQLVYDALGKALGKPREEVEKLMAAGKITDAQGIAATMEAISKGLSGGTLGGAMEKKSKTLSGLWSTLASIPEELVFSANMSAVIDPIKEFLKLLTAALGPDSPAGKRVVAMLEMIGKAIGELFAGFTGGDITKTLDAILNVAEPLLTVFLAYGKALIGGLGSVLGPVVKWLGELTKDPETLQMITDAFVTLGKAIGIALGIVIVTVGAILALEAAIAALIGGFMDLSVAVGESIANAFRGLWDQLATMSWQELGMAIVQGILNGILAMFSPAGGVMGMLGEHLFNSVLGGAGGGNGAAPAPAGSVQPGAAAGSTTGAAQEMGGGSSNVNNVSVPQIIINAIAGESPEDTGRRAGESFMSQLGASLKGLMNEAGG